MRISDWSSDVCSSDLRDLEARASGQVGVGRALRAVAARRAVDHVDAARLQLVGQRHAVLELPAAVDAVDRGDPHEQRQLFRPYRAHRLGDLQREPHAALAIAAVTVVAPVRQRRQEGRSEEHTSELQSLMRISYAVFCLKKKNNTHNQTKK